jgi:hypothetical protein
MPTEDPARRWHQRVQDAKLFLDFAVNFRKEVEADQRSGHIPSADGHFAYQRALHAETAAHKEHMRVLRIFNDLLVNGKIPDEDRKPGTNTATAGDSD